MIHLMAIQLLFLAIPAKVAEMSPRLSTYAQAGCEQIGREQPIP